jgi:hypothetical protein
MISVEQLIGDLLLRHNCVIVPTFGGFVANQSSATIDYALGTMVPPKKSLLFNRQLINNDGLLVSEYARINAVTYTDASDHVLNTATRWMDTLRRGERVTLENIGQLYFDYERNIRFDQDRFFNLLLQSYGLGKVHFVSEKQAETVVTGAAASKTETPIRSIDFAGVDQVEEKDNGTDTAEPKELKKRSKAWRYVAAACFLPIAFYSYWIPVKTDVLESGMLSISDFNPFYHSVDGSYQTKALKLRVFPEKERSLDEDVSELPTDVKVFSYAFDDDTFIPVKIEAPVSVNEPSAETQEPSSNAFNAGMHFVVGCFASETNANNLVDKLRANGFDASIVGQANGLIRVSAGGALSEEALQQVVTKAGSLGFSGWVLRQ